MEDLRAEVDDDGPEAERFLAAVADDWRTAELTAADAALCAYAVKLTAEPSEMGEADVRALRDAGFDDDAVLDAVQVASFFNYINRVADAVHVDLEDDMPPYPTNGHPR